MASEKRSRARASVSIALRLLLEETAGRSCIVTYISLKIIPRMGLESLHFQAEASRTRRAKYTASRATSSPRAVGEMAELCFLPQMHTDRHEAGMICASSCLPLTGMIKRRISR